MNNRTGYPDGYLIYLVKQLELGIRRPFEQLITRHGISTAGYTALSVLQSRQGITSSELARRSFVRAQTMAETVSALVESGLVRREKDPAHGRQIFLYITEAGRSRVAALAPDVLRLESEIISGLADGEPAELVRALRVCRDALSASPPAGR
ncbi:MAG: MarR family winged helix-turn-helix transcriptional regulator [Pseudolysinimonas sp.]